MTSYDDATTRRNTPDVFGARWEEWAKKQLQTTGYDPELGVEAAKDALRLVGGRLSEVEFQSKYYEGYRREFGIDARPSNPARVEEARDAFVNKRISRRTMLKLTGAAVAGFVLLPILNRTVQAANSEGAVQESAKTDWSLSQYGLVVDLERCIGCLDCAVACYAHEALLPWQHWIYVLSYVDNNQEKTNYLPITCQHCTNPPCVKVCPVESRFKRKEDGLVLIDYDTCIGCKYCEVACPYGVNYFQWGDPDRDVHREKYWGNRTVSGLPPGNEREVYVSGRPPRSVMGKCNWCPDHQGTEAMKGTLPCEIVCRSRVLHFGNLNDPASKPNRYLRDKQKEKGYITTFRLLEQIGTEPNVIYIGQQPSAKAKRVAGSVAYEHVGLVDNERAALDFPKPTWFSRFIRGDWW